MSLLDLFRKKTPSPAGDPAPLPVPAPPLPDAIPVSAPSSAEAATDTAAVGSLAASAAEATQPAEPTLRAYDEFGREVMIPASQWRRDVLPQALEQAKNNPEALSSVLLEALGAGAAADVLAQAAHLQSTDTIPERGAAVHGLVLLAAGQPAEAEDVLVTYLGQHGPSATVLSHLARVQASQQRLEEADATLWRALEADPNEEGALGLYAARSREREGEFGWQTALERAATLPGAWLPLMWLGRSALEARNRTLAVGLYKQAIERAGRPAPALLLQGVSGDLGRFGLVEDALRLVRPAFDLQAHGLAVGNNLLRATLDSGQAAEALSLLRDLRRLGRPEYAAALRRWEIEIRRRDLFNQAQANPPQPNLLRLDGPVWLPSGSPTRSLFATAAPRRGTVLFLGSSVAMPEGLPEETATALADTAGRLSRALPLFLAEHAFALLALDTQVMVPWAEVAGFALLHQPWPDAMAAAYARDLGARAAVTTHLHATAEGTTVALRIVPAAPAAMAPDAENSSAPGTLAEGAGQSAAFDALAASPEPDSPAVPEATQTPTDAAADASTADGSAGAEDEAPAAEPATVELTLSWPEMHQALSSLWPQLAIPLVTLFGDAPEPPRPGRYNPPRGPELNAYLRLLEQLLAIHCACSSRHAPLLVVGEEEAVRSLLDLALRLPNSLPVRLMLGELLLRLRAVHPELLNEFGHSLQLLMERHPLPDVEANDAIRAQLAAAYAPLQPQPVEPAS